MRSVKNILLSLVALAAILSTSLWSSAASACLFDATPSVVGGSSMAMPAHHAAHKSTHPAAITHKAPAPAVPGGPAGPRLDCAACMAVLPSFPSIGPHELMPFMPEAQTFEPLFGIDPVLDPPPPRRSKP